MSADLTLMAKRASQGDREAFRVIVRSTQDRLYRMAARMTGSTADAEDVVQDAYLKAHRALCRGSFDGRSSVGTWLYRIAANTALDHLRRSQTRKEEPQSSDARVDQHVSSDARLALAELAQWLEDLPPDQRAALVLKSVEGLTSKEVAEALGRSEGAVEQLLVRARATLKKRRQTND